MEKKKLFINIIISFVLVIFIGFIFYIINSKIFLYDEIEYGKYYINENEYGKVENINWIVIEKNNDSVLLLSKNAIDVISYDKKSNNIKWEDSDLRIFLNKDFYNNSFNEYEKNNFISIERKIRHEEKVDVSQDKVSILSISDIENLKIRKNILECHSTKYAIYKGIYEFRDNLVRYFIINDVKGEKYRYKQKLDMDFDYGLYGPFHYYSDEFVEANEEWVGVRPIIKLKLINGKIQLENN